MGWDKIEETGQSSEERKSAADKSNAEARQQAADLARRYHRILNTDDALKLIEDLTKRFIFNNVTSLDATNPDYEAAYHNGEAGVVKYIINQITIARKL